MMMCECGKNLLVEVEWTVSGMNCEDSAESLQMTLEEIAAVRGVRVNLPKQSVRVGFDAGFTSEQKLKEVLCLAGFQVALSREEVYRLEIFGGTPSRLAS